MGRLVCLDKETGKEVWMHQFGSELNFIAETNDIIFAVNANYDNGHGRMFGYNRFTGEELWHRALVGSSIHNAYAYKGWFYYIESGDLTVIDTKTGTTVHTYSLPNSIPVWSVSFGGDKVFIASWDRLYCLKAYHTINR